MKSDVIFARDLDQTGSMHVCSKEDPGARDFVDRDKVLSILHAAREGEIDGDFRSLMSRIQRIS